jgi:hypothetical protein
MNILVVNPNTSDLVLEVILDQFIPYQRIWCGCKHAAAREGLTRLARRISGLRCG